MSWPDFASLIMSDLSAQARADLVRLRGALFVVLAVLLTGGIAFIGGRLTMAADYERAALKAAGKSVAAAADRTLKSADITAAAVVDLADKKTEIRTVTKTIIEKVPVYVPQKADAGCTVPVGAIHVLNAAANLSELPETAGGAEAAPSGVALSTVVGTVAGNYGTCHEVSAGYQALWDWSEKQYELGKDGAAK